MHTFLPEILARIQENLHLGEAPGLCRWMEIHHVLTWEQQWQDFFCRLDSNLIEHGCCHHIPSNVAKTGVKPRPSASQTAVRAYLCEWERLRGSQEPSEKVCAGVNTLTTANSAETAGLVGPPPPSDQQGGTRQILPAPQKITHLLLLRGVTVWFPPNAYPSSHSMQKKDSYSNHKIYRSKVVRRVRFPEDLLMVKRGKLAATHHPSHTWAFPWKVDWALTPSAAGPANLHLALNILRSGYAQWTPYLSQDKPMTLHISTRMSIPLIFQP